MAIRVEPHRTKLLVATLGLATVSYLGCSNASPPGNLMAPPENPSEAPPGNLMAPPAMPSDQPTATVATPTAVLSASAAPSASALPTAKPTPLPHPVGNLMAPPQPLPKKAQ